MNADLADFLAKHTPFDEEMAMGGAGTMPLRIISYLGDVLPLSDYITSVRSIVFRDEAVLVLRNMHSLHIMPGGRREMGESLEETLHREVLEETGWTLTNISVLGFRHLHHLAPRPPAYSYPHPDFLWVGYMVDAVECLPDVVPDDYELASTFRSLTEVQTLGLTQAERIYLDAGRKIRTHRPVGL